MNEWTNERMNERMNERTNGRRMISVKLLDVNTPSGKPTKVELAEFFLVPWSQYSSSGISRCVYLYVEIGMMQGYKL